MRATTSKLGVGFAALALVLASGCGGDSEGDDSGEDFAGLSGQKIADAAEKDMKDLEAMRYAGRIVSEGTEISLDIQASSSGACTGSIDVAGGSVEVLSTGDESWFRADEAFWNANAGEDAATVIAAVGDKWVVDTNEEFAQFCDLDEFRDSLFDESDGETTYTNKGADEIDGKDVVEVESKDDKGTSSGFILVEGDHYLVRIVSTDEANGGEVTFSDFDEEVTAEAPGEDEIVDLNDVG